MSERRRLRAVFALGILASLCLPLSVDAQQPKPSVVGPQPAAAQPAADRPVLRIGTNLVAGLYYPTGGALCRLVAKVGETRCLVESTNGSTANIRGLLAGDLEFGIVQSDWQYHAAQGSASFRETGAVKSLRSVMSLHAEPLTLVVRSDSGIVDFDQIKGKRIAAGPADSGQRILFDILIAAQGWRAQDFASLPGTSPDETVQAFCAGEIDGVLSMGNHPNAVTQRLLACKGRLVAVAGPAIARIVAERRYYAPASIPAGLYGAGQAEIATLGVRATLVTLESVPADVVYGLVRAVGERFSEFVAQHPGLTNLKREEIAQFGLTAPMHEGALRYYREVGLIK